MKRKFPRVRKWDAVESAVRDGANYGANRLFKHRDTLTSDDHESIVEEISRAIMGELAERFDFEAP